MKSWEYKFDRIGGYDLSLEKTLNEHGRDGWELVSVVYLENGPHSTYRLIFKREII